MIGKKVLQDQELIDLIKKGDQEALVYLYEQNYPSIRNHILKNSGSDDDIDDIMQEAVVAVWQNVSSGNFSLSSKLSTYVFAIAKNLWFKQLSKKSRLSDLDDSYAEKLSAEEKDLVSMDAKLISKFVEKLGDTCRQLLSFFYFDGLNMTEIAERLSFANTDTAKAKKYQCLKKLEEMVKNRFTKADFMG